VGSGSRIASCPQTAEPEANDSVAIRFETRLRRERLKSSFVMDASGAEFGASVKLIDGKGRTNC
jgi:hypothetical protein